MQKHCHTVHDHAIYYTTWCGSVRDGRVEFAESSSENLKTTTMNQTVSLKIYFVNFYTRYMFFLVAYHGRALQHIVAQCVPRQSGLPHRSWYGIWPGIETGDGTGKDTRFKFNRVWSWQCLAASELSNNWLTTNCLLFVLYVRLIRRTVRVVYTQRAIQQNIPSIISLLTRGCLRRIPGGPSSLV